MSDEYDLEYDEDDSGYSAGYSDGYDDGCAESAELCDALDAAEARVAWLEGMAEELAEMLRTLGDCDDMFLECNLCVGADLSTTDDCPIDTALTRFAAGQDTEA